MGDSNTALLTHLKSILTDSNFSADSYNTLVGFVRQGLIKDITPPEMILHPPQVVLAIIELPDDSRWEIDIHNPPDLANPDNKYNYKCEVKRYLLMA